MSKITIFGLAGTGTTSAGKALSEQLGYDFISSGALFRKKAQEMNISLGELEAFANNDPKFDNELDRQIEKYGKEHGDFVIESRLAWFFVPDSFKVKLTCYLETRIKRVAERDNIDFDTAKRLTKLRENLIFDRYTKYYGVDLNTLADKKFDLIIDTADNDTQTVVKLIQDALAKRPAASAKSNPSDKSAL